MACNLNADPRRVPGGRVATIGGWVVEHCVGPLGIGTMVVKPQRHVEHLAGLTRDEAAELGPLLARVAGAVSRAAAASGELADQVYACLWSHAGRRPGHIHFVVQPVSRELMARFDAHGPALQVRMFEAGEPIDPALAAAAADRVRVDLAAG